MRVNGQPRRPYVGTGLIGQLACQFDEAERQRKSLGAAQNHLDRAEVEGLDEDLLAVEQLADVLARAALVAAGFHQHDHGAWRRKRERK